MSVKPPASTDEIHPLSLLPKVSWWSSEETPGSSPSVLMLRLQVPLSINLQKGSQSVSLRKSVENCMWSGYVEGKMDARVRHVTRAAGNTWVVLLVHHRCSHLALISAVCVCVWGGCSHVAGVLEFSPQCRRLFERWDRPLEMKHRRGSRCAGLIRIGQMGLNAVTKMLPGNHTSMTLTDGILLLLLLLFLGIWGRNILWEKLP